MNVLLDEEHPHAARAEFVDVGVDLVDDDRARAQGRFVQQQILRVAQQRPAQRDHLLLSAGKQRDLLVGPVAQHRREFQHLAQPGPLHPARPDDQVLPHRHPGEEPASLVDDRDPMLPHPPVGGQVVAAALRAHEDLAARLDQPEDRADDRRLASSIGPDQGEAPSVLEREAHVEEGLGALVERASASAPQACLPVPK